MRSFKPWTKRTSKDPNFRHLTSPYRAGWWKGRTNFWNHPKSNGTHRKKACPRNSSKWIIIFPTPCSHLEKNRQINWKAVVSVFTGRKVPSRLGGYLWTLPRSNWKKWRRKSLKKPGACSQETKAGRKRPADRDKVSGLTKESWTVTPGPRTFSMEPK